MSTYPNQFARIGISDAAVLSRLSDCFSTIFSPPKTTFTILTPLIPMLPAWSTPATTTRAPRA